MQGAVVVDIHRGILGQEQQLVDRPIAVAHHLIEIGLDLVLIEQPAIHDDAGGRIVGRGGNIARGEVHAIADAAVFVDQTAPPIGIQRQRGHVAKIGQNALDSKRFQAAAVDGGDAHIKGLIACKIIVFQRLHAFVGIVALHILNGNAIALLDLDVARKDGIANGLARQLIAGNIDVHGGIVVGIQNGECLPAEILLSQIIEKILWGRLGLLSRAARLRHRRRGGHSSRRRLTRFCSFPAGYGSQKHTESQYHR